MDEPLTRFETNLLRLKFVANRLELIFKEFPKLENKQNEYTFKSTVRDYAILQLWIFINIREWLATDFARAGKLSFDPCLKPILEPILNHRDAIKEVRNGYIAHLQEEADKPFKETIESIIIKSGFPSSAGDILLMMGCVWCYRDTVKLNFLKEWESAETKYKKMRPEQKPSGNLTENEVKGKLDELAKQVLANLSNNGFTTPKHNIR